MITIPYYIEDTESGIPLLVDADIVDFEDGDMPEIVITNITDDNGRHINVYILSDWYIKHLKNSIFSEWCRETNRGMD